MWIDNEISYIVTCNLDHFRFWAGAKDRMDGASPKQREKVYDRIKFYFETFDYCNGDYPTETDINDLVWFECDDIFFPDEDEGEDE